MRLPILAAGLALLAASASSAMAGPAEDLAKTRIAAIASGDLASVTSAYAPAATLHWVGGPLDGTYGQADKIKEVWTKFFAAQGSQKATIATTTEAANPKGGTVTADVTFAGKNTVKVRYILLYRDGKLADEIWQVNPAASY
ncbi:nuclear transport factor 2 family protein [Roseixanthobacter glucoisosaccharinicivorans]|uniref:nuclear transport factor 2 family protein n=1 Tax=Roseixanthobacter glucoisosaccharinicivorans TaxID=3119923 RepID=UPI0037288CEB